MLRRIADFRVSSADLPTSTRLRIRRGESPTLFPSLKRVPARHGDHIPRLLRVCKTPSRLIQPLPRLAKPCGFSGLWICRRSVLIELVVFAPIVAVVCGLPCFHPFLRLHAINIRLEGGRLARGEEVLGRPVPGEMMSVFVPWAELGGKGEGKRTEATWRTPLGICRGQTWLLRTYEALNVAGRLGAGDALSPSARGNEA